MQYFIRAALLVSILSLLSCTATRKGNKPSTDDGKLEVVFVQVNDVYEIAPVSGGKSGGVARVATLKKEIQKVIVGQEQAIDQLLMAFLAGGHALLEGVPGLAKTLMIRTLADAIEK